MCKMESSLAQRRSNWLKYAYSTGSNVIIFRYYNNFDVIVHNYIVKWLSVSGDLVQELLFVFSGIWYLLQHYGLKEEVS